ncbi:MAG TPA: glycosyltransferase [Bacteroidia bacterium]|jgi:glycosyltransferase involved in cell wall biosynthesis|nr:glycosyltransferase [Bacteroidia bacterium]
MYRVFRLINRFNLGGPTFNVTYLSKFLSPEFETLLAGGVKDESEASSEHIPLQYGIKPLIIENMKRSINPANDIIAYNNIKKIIKEYKPHIVHTHASKAGSLGRMAAIACKVPVIVHTFHGHVFHSYFNNIQTSVYKNIERYLASKSTALIALSEQQKTELSEIHRIAPAEKFHIIPLGFDLERFWTNTEEKRKNFRAKYSLNDDTVAVGIMGRLVPIKNHALFLTAFKNAKEKTDKPVKAFIIGDGEFKQTLVSQCIRDNLSYSTPEKPNLTASIIFTSWITDIDTAMAGMDIIALSSLNEGTPVSLIEAQAAGKPVVSTIAGGIENVVIPNETALLSPVNDTGLFSENLHKLLNNNELREKLSQKGKAFVSKNFSYISLADNVGSLYKKLLQEKGLWKIEN